MEINIDDLNCEYLASTGGKPPNDRYFAVLKDAKIVTWKTESRQVLWDFEVVDTRTAKRFTVRKYHTLKPGLMQFLTWDLNKLGMRLNHINELHDALRSMIGSVIEIDFCQGDPWDEIRILRLVSRPK